MGVVGSRQRQGPAVRGVVEAWRAIRDRLRAGVAQQDAPRLRFDVRRALAAIERACRRAGRTPDELPEPSRSAWRSLRDLDLDALPGRDEGPAPCPAVRFPGAAVATDALARGLWSDVGRAPGARLVTAGVLQRQRDALDHACRRLGSAPWALQGPARPLFAWCARLAEPARLDAHREALGRARDALKRRLNASPDEIPVVVAHGGALWRRCGGPDGAFLRISQGFESAPPGVWEALLAVAAGRPTPARVGRVRAFAEDEAFREVVRSLEAAVEPPDAARGRACDLGVVFDRINASCFAGSQTRPLLGWTAAPTTRLLGCYRPGSDRVLLSSSLDDPSVPTIIHDYLMFHELLHREQGAEFDGPRRRVHTPAFRARERTFPGAAEAEAWIRERSRGA